MPIHVEAAAPPAAVIAAFCDLAAGLDNRSSRKVRSSCEMNQHSCGEEAARKTQRATKPREANPTQRKAFLHPSASARVVTVGMMRSEPIEMPMSSIDVPQAFSSGSPGAGFGIHLDRKTDEVGNMGPCTAPIRAITTHMPLRPKWSPAVGTRMQQIAERNKASVITFLEPSLSASAPPGTWVKKYPVAIAASMLPLAAVVISISACM
mmetsp:Transcript_50985/g.114659  ORF Transcript_50985/g.114659 Transcript_50985/m.114659 type:complete len:208 (-) Transcript_50985:126-749(-)